MEIIDEGQFIQVSKPSWEYIDDINPEKIMNKLEQIIRVCYKSEDKISEGSAERLVSNIVKSGHTAMLEHASITVKFYCSRGCSHELVRHRHCGFAQESSRYCSYNKDKFGNKITVIKPNDFKIGSSEYIMWKESMERSGQAYFDLKNMLKVQNDMARGVLPTDLKTEIVVTASIREWRAIFDLRCSEKAHPEIRNVMKSLLFDMNSKMPILFGDIADKYLK